MTFDAITVPDLSVNEQGALTRLVAGLRGVSDRNKMLSAYFDGESSLRSAGIILPAHMAGTASVLGWPERAVEALNNRCVLEGFNAPTDLDSLGLSTLLEDNRFDVEFPQATLSSLIHGPGFLISTKGGDDEPEALITAKDALSGFGEWDSRRRVLRDFLSVLAVDDKGAITRLALYLPGLTIECVKDGAWKVVNRSTHPYGVPVEPLTHQPRLDKPLGSSRINRAIRASNDRALRAVIRTEVTAEFYSVPQRILLGADESAFQGPDGSSRSPWQARLLSVWAIPDDEEAENPRADVKEFSAASQEPHLAQLRAEAQIFSGLSGIPIGELGLSNDANPTSADAYLASREPLIAKAERTMDAWTPAVRRTIVRALSMLNGWEDGAPAEVEALTTSWRNPKYESRAAVADAGAKQIGTAPWLAETEVGLELLGLTPDQIERALAEKTRAEASQRTAALLEAARSGLAS
nr:MAG TPA_asm: PORTAL PROTEIN [Caudoviricetes sp.]